MCVGVLILLLAVPLLSVKEDDDLVVVVCGAGVGFGANCVVLLVAAAKMYTAHPAVLLQSASQSSCVAAGDNVQPDLPHAANPGSRGDHG